MLVSANSYQPVFEKLQDSVRELVRATLVSYGYEVIATACGKTALDVASKRSDGIQLLITDLMMPSVSGHELSRRLRERGSTIPVLYISGYCEETALQNDIRPGMDAFLHKPFLPNALARKVRSVLDGCVHPG